jgi:hypothetical protein
MTFGNFLKDLDHMIFKQYLLERYADGDQKKPTANVENLFKTEEPVFGPTRLIDSLMERIDKLPKDHEVIARLFNCLKSIRNKLRQQNQGL